MATTNRVNLDFILDIGAFDAAKHEKQMAEMIAAGQSGNHLDGSVCAADAVPPGPSALHRASVRPLPPC